MLSYDFRNILNNKINVVDNSSGLFSNLAATIAPTTSNDVSQGYVIGSLWVDTVADIAYTCVDNSLGNAVWKSSTLTIDDTSSNLTSVWSSSKVNTLTGGYTTNIATNATDIGNNSTNIGTNTTNIATNATDIGNNSTNIGTNTTNIGTNTGNISTQDTSINSLNSTTATHTNTIANHDTTINLNYNNIVQAVLDIIANTNNISTNAGNIATNTSDITTLSSSGSQSITAQEWTNLGTSGSQSITAQEWSNLGTSGSRSISSENWLHVSKMDQAIDIGSYPSFGTVRSTYTSGSGSLGYRQIFIMHPLNNTAGWIIGNQRAAPSTGDNDLYFEVVYSNGVANTAGFLQNSSSNIQMNFTGQHRCMPMFNYTTDLIGRIVNSTGSYCNMISAIGDECSNSDSITINDCLPKVELCNTIRSKRVFGVISDREDERQFGGNFTSIYKKAEGDERLFINGLGEGAIWVSNINGNLENGDYICSYLNGYGQKQDDDLYHNYTVAKVTMDCDFSPVQETVKIYSGYDESTQSIIWTDKLDDDGNAVQQPRYQVKEIAGVLYALVGCVYLCS